MGLDAVPSGFSSAAAVTLLKTMRSTQSANSSFIAEPTTSPFQASSKSTVSGDTIFSIISAAARTRSATTASSSNHASASQSDTDGSSSTPADNAQATVGGAQALVDDPYFTASYTIEQAAQNWYAEMDRLVASMRNTAGETKQGQTDGQILAERSQFTGDQAATFAAKFDSKSLTFTDSTAVGVATNKRTWIQDGSGGTIGYSVAGHVDGAAMTKWREANPNSMLIGDEGYRGGALLISW